MFLVNLSIDVSPNAPKANRATDSTSMSDGLIDSWLNVLAIKAVTNATTHKSPATLLDEILFVSSLTNSFQNPISYFFIGFLIGFFTGVGFFSGGFLFFTGTFKVEKVKENLKDIKKWRVTRDSVWSAYLKCEMSPEEQKIVDRVNDQIKAADELIDELIDNVDDNKNIATTDSIISSGEIDDLINPIMDDTNALIDLQSSEGAALVKEIQDLLKTFSNFMIGVLALAFILLVNVVMKFLKDKKEAQVPVKKRKPPVKKTTPVKKPIKKPIKK